jgi:hypothetical protein
MLSFAAKSNAKCVKGKLDIDFLRHCRLPVSRRRHMDDDERGELVRRLFYLMTAKLEDAAAQAAEGQRSGPVADKIMRAGLIRSAAQETLIVAEATIALLQGCRPSS